MRTETDLAEDRPTGRSRIVIAERIQRYPEDDLIVFHLPDGPSIDEFQPVRCGGGVTLHGTRERVQQSEVCADCLSGNRTL